MSKFKSIEIRVLRNFIDMPVTKQAIKKVRADRCKAIINLRLKKALKKAIVTFRKKPSSSLLTAVYKAADKAVKGNVIHENKASRIKSRLSKLIASKKQLGTKKAAATKD